MSLTINGATNTLTAASGLAIAGNTAVTGTLSATGLVTGSAKIQALRAAALTQLVEIDGGGASGNFITGVSSDKNLYIRCLSDSTTVSNSMFLQVGTTATPATVLGISSTGLAVTGTLSATGQISGTYSAGGYTQGALKTTGSADYVALSMVNTGVTWDIASIITSAPDRFVIRNSTTSADAFVINADAPDEGMVLGATALTLGTGVAMVVADTTDATSTTAASLKTAGGLAVAKKLYVGDSIIGSYGSDLFIKLTTTGTANAAYVNLESGNGTTSGRYAYTLLKALETSPQEWRIGMLGSKNYSVQNTTLGNSALTIDSTNGNINTVGNIVMASGKGIDFSATANGSGTTTSEVLSDYEEGTFTPTIAAASGTITSYTSSGHYVKVGRLVQVQVIASITNAGTGAGALSFTVPFTSNTGGVSSAGSGIETAAVGFACTCYIGTNSTTAFAYRDAFSTPIGTGNSLIFTLTFQTA